MEIKQPKSVKPKMGKKTQIKKWYKFARGVKEKNTKQTGVKQGLGVYKSQLAPTEGSDPRLSRMLTVQPQTPRTAY